MNSYQPLNFMNTDRLFKEEDRLVRDSVRHFVDEHVMPRLQQAHREETFPVDLIPQFGALGLLGSYLKGYGCAGLSAMAYGLVMQELERADSGIRSFCSVQGALVMWPIFTYGSDAQKQKYLPQLAKGELIGCFGLTEPDFGSNPGGMLTKAEKTSRGYRLNGTKLWITNGHIADLALVWAKCEGTIRGFLIPKNTPGFTARPIKGKFSLRVSVTSELHCENCEVPDEAILPNAHGLKAAFGCLSEARYGIAWGALGAANAVYHAALTYAGSRIVFGKPLAAQQLVQAKLVKMVQEITKAELLCIQLAKLKEEGILESHQISLAKMNNARMALDCAREARDILGANGIVDEYPVIRHLLNLETVNTYEGTEDIHRLVIGAFVTGLPAFK